MGKPAGKPTCISPFRPAFKWIRKRKTGLCLGLHPTHQPRGPGARFICLRAGVELTSLLKGYLLVHLFEHIYRASSVIVWTWEWNYNKWNEWNRWDILHWFENLKQNLIAMRRSSKRNMKKRKQNLKISEREREREKKKKKKGTPSMW